MNKRKKITCIGCGCTDDNACPGGCYWIKKSEKYGLGLCSLCKNKKELFTGRLNYLKLKNKNNGNNSKKSK